VSEPLDLEPIKEVLARWDELTVDEVYDLAADYTRPLVREVEKLRDGIAVAVEVIDNVQGQVAKLESQLGWKVPD
jgi:hypothetical protein